MHTVCFGAQQYITSWRKEGARLRFCHRFFILHVLTLGHASSLDDRRRGEVVADANWRLVSRGRSHMKRRGISEEQKNHDKRALIENDYFRSDNVCHTCAEASLPRALFDGIVQCGRARVCLVSSSSKTRNAEMKFTHHHLP